MKKFFKDLVCVSFRLFVIYSLAISVLLNIGVPLGQHFGGTTMTGDVALELLESWTLISQVEVSAKTKVESKWLSQEDTVEPSLIHIDTERADLEGVIVTITNSDGEMVWARMSKLKKRGSADKIGLSSVELPSPGNLYGGYTIKVLLADGSTVSYGSYHREKKSFLSQDRKKLSLVLDNLLWEKFL